MSRREAAPPEEADNQEQIRARIIAAGAEILAKGDREDLTTRAVAAHAGVQAPTLYRLFGDKHGLLEAVAEDAMRRFVKKKSAKVLRDPLEDLRSGWDLTVAFGLAHPAIFSFMNGDPRPGHVSPAAAAGHVMLTEKVERLAKAGLLRVSVERAVNLIRAAGVGTVFLLLGMEEGKRDAGLSKAACEGVIASITRGTPIVEEASPRGAAIALRASLAQTDALSPGERLLLSELLVRLVAHDG